MNRFYFKKLSKKFLFNFILYLKILFCGLLLFSAPYIAGYLFLGVMYIISFTMKIILYIL